MSSNPNRRTLRGKLIRPRQQLRISFLIVGFGTFGVTLFALITALSFRRTLDLLRLAYNLDEDFVIQAWGSLGHNLAVIATLALIVGVATLVFSVLWTHRIYGPMIPIKAQLERLAAGDYSGQVSLRDGDEFTEIADAVNQLAARLRENQSR